MQLKKNLFLIVSLFYTLCTIFPLFGDLIRFPVWLPSIFSSVVLIALFPSAIMNKTFYWFVIYAVVLFIFVISGKPLTIGIGSVIDSKKILIEFAFILPAVTIFSGFYYLQDYHLISKYIVLSLIILYLSFVITVPLMIRYNSLREALGEQAEDTIIPGLPGYSLMHAYTLLVPVFCYFFKRTSGKWQILSLGALLSLCYVIYTTYVTTSLLIMILVLFASFFCSEKGGQNMWIVILYSLLVLFILYEAGFFVTVISSIKPLFIDTPVESKLNDFQKSMMEGQVQGGTIVIRQRLHEMSLTSFFSNPLVGTPEVGGHSSILDRLGGMGILGGIPFIMIFVTAFKYLKRLFTTRLAKDFFWMGVVASFIFLIGKGNWGSESWLMCLVLMPFGILTYENRSSRSE